MSRWEFMRKLEELLSDISPNEREEALQYYNDYFNDAGRENEQEVIDALGSPEQVAQIVKEGLLENEVQGEFTENGYTRNGSGIQNKPATYSAERSGSKEKADSDREDFAEGSWREAGAGESASYRETGEEGSGSRTHGTWNEGESKTKGTSFGTRKEEMPSWELVLIVIGCICLLPVILPLVCSILAAVFSVIGVAVAVVFGMGVATLVLYAVAIALIIAGFSCIFTYPATGLGLLGGGCICGALGFLFMIAVAFLAGKGVPAVCKGIKGVFRKISDRKRGNAV